MKHLSQLFLCALLVLSAGRYICASSMPGIIVYYSSQNSYQKLLASAIKRRLNNVLSSTPVKFITDNDLSVIGTGDLIISIGNQKKIDMSLGALKNDVIYINDVKDNDHTPRNNNSYINTSITQPPCRQLELISIINERWKHVGYLVSNPGDSRLAQLKTCSKRLKVTINDVHIKNNDLPNAIDNVLEDSDVLLALPDIKIYNRRSVKNILLSAYRERIPVIGFSDSFVTAGAIAATYSTPDQIAHQLITIILARMKNGKLPANRNIYPEYFSVRINRQVANALNINLPDENSIKSSIQNMETKP